jgi:hypothetical protein
MATSLATNLKSDVLKNLDEFVARNAGRPNQLSER